MKSTWCYPAIALVSAVSMWSQPPIRLKAADVETAGNRLDARAPGHRHWIVQFHSYPGAEIRAELARRGMRVLEYVPEFALLVSAGAHPDLGGLDAGWAGPLAARQKISPLAASGRYEAFIVSFHADADMERARETVATAGLKMVEQTGLLPNHLLVSGPPDRLNALTDDDDVAYVFPAGWELRLRRPPYRCGGVITEAGPLAEYALEGPGWPKDAGGGVTLGYFFNSLPGKLDSNTVRTEIERALSQWQRYANVNFAPAQAPGGARSLDVTFATGSHGDPYPFSGSSTLAHTYFPAPPNLEPVAGDIHFNNAVNWQVGSSVDVFSVALHEAGHALGLAHSDNPSAVMYPYYNLSTGLSNDDIAAVQALYGNRGAQPPPVTPTPTQPPNPPPAPPAPTPPSTPPGSDTTPPSLTVLSPAGTIVSAYTGSITISGTARDNVAVARVAWSNSNGGSGTAQGTVSWSATVPLLVGNNVITLRAYDGAGNSAWRSITVVRH